MCGIYAYIGESNSTGDIILQGLKKLEYRGYDSWGISIVVNGKIQNIKDIGSVKKNLEFKDSHIGIGHTRWATSGNITKINSHPHYDCTKSITVVHNGIIENFKKLKTELLKKGHVFISETDTEVLSHEIEEELSLGKSLEDAVINTFNKISGINAFVVLSLKYKKIVGITNGSPIIVTSNNDGTYLSSDLPSLSKISKNFVILENNQLVKINKKGFKIIDTITKTEIIPNKIKAEIDYTEDTLKPNETWLLKEIEQEPDVLKLILDTSLSDINILTNEINKSKYIYMIGAGSSYHLALYFKYMLTKLGISSEVFIASEFPYFIKTIHKESLLIAFSQSGETLDILDCIGIAKSNNMRIVSITNSIFSSLQRKSDICIPINAGVERSVIATKSFVATLSILTLTYNNLNKNINAGEKDIENAINTINNILSLNSHKKFIDIARKISKYDHLFSLGKGQSFPIALETALKIKEGSYIHAEAFNAGELKHGALALIEKNTPCILFAPKDSTYQSIISATREVKSRGAFTIGITYKEDPIFDDYFLVPYKESSWWIVSTIIIQILAYHLTILRGNNPDKPRNLAKSVTVR